MTKRKTKTKKRNPNDATMRNIRALKKRCKRLEDTLGTFIGWMAYPDLGESNVRALIKMLHEEKKK